MNFVCIYQKHFSWPQVRLKFAQTKAVKWHLHCVRYASAPQSLTSREPCSSQQEQKKLHSHMQGRMIASLAGQERNKRQLCLLKVEHNQVPSIPLPTERFCWECSRARSDSSPSQIWICESSRIRPAPLCASSLACCSWRKEQSELWLKEP